MLVRKNMLDKTIAIYNYNIEIAAWFLWICSYIYWSFVTFRSSSLKRNYSIFFLHVWLYVLCSCEKELTVIKTAVMNPNISKDVKLTHSTEEVVERINTLHWYVNLKFSKKKNGYKIYLHYINVWKWQKSFTLSLNTKRFLCYIWKWQ